MNITEKLYEALASFERDDQSLSQFNDEGQRMSEVIENVFDEAGFEPGTYDVESNIVFSCPSADFGYVSVAWIENGKLHHQNYEFE